MFTRLVNSLAELSETPAAGVAGLSSGVDGMEFVGPSPSPSKAPSDRPPRAASDDSMRLVPSTSSLGSVGSPSPDRSVWRRLANRAGRFIQDMVDLDDEAGIEDRDVRQWSPDKREQNTNELDLGPLGEMKEPEALYPEDVDDTNCNDIGFHYDREPSELSRLVSINDMNAIISHTPLRHRHKKWVLLYSTLRDGISMQTLLRKARGHAPTILLVRDMSRHVFGAFCSESWRVSQRYFGTGETFVFRVEPHPAIWKWWHEKSNEQQNDFFLWGSPDGIAVGGAGGYAIWLDSNLCHGLSRCSATFGNSCLASSEEFSVGAVELWG